MAGFDIGTYVHNGVIQNLLKVDTYNDCGNIGVDGCLTVMKLRIGVQNIAQELVIKFTNIIPDHTLK